MILQVVKCNVFGLNVTTTWVKKMVTYSKKADK